MFTLMPTLKKLPLHSILFTFNIT